MGSHLKVTHPLFFSCISLLWFPPPPPPPPYSSSPHSISFVLVIPFDIPDQAESWVWLQRHSSMFWPLMIASLTEPWLRGSSKPLLIMVIYLPFPCSLGIKREVFCLCLLAFMDLDCLSFVGVFYFRSDCSGFRYKGFRISGFSWRWTKWNRNSLCFSKRSPSGIWSIDLLTEFTIPSLLCLDHSLTSFRFLFPIGFRW